MTPLIAQQHDTLDLMCWRFYGRTQSVLERVIEANPHLPNYGNTLPLGTPVLMPDTPPPTPKPTLSLWD